MRKYATIAIRDPDLFDSLFEVHVPLLNEEGQCQSGRPVMSALASVEIVKTFATSLGCGVYS